MTAVDTLTAPAPVHDPMIVRPVGIKRTFWETDDTFTLVLDLEPSFTEFTFRAGQFNMPPSGFERTCPWAPTCREESTRVLLLPFRAI